MFNTQDGVVGQLDLVSDIRMTKILQSTISKRENDLNKNIGN